MSDKQNSTKPTDISADPRWGWSPVSRRYVLRTGATWKRLIKAGVVQDEEVAAQLARPAQGTVRKPKVNNVTIQADRDAVANTISENFDASRLTGAQLQQIAAELARLSSTSCTSTFGAAGAAGARASGTPKTRSRERKPARQQYKALTGVSHRRSSRAPPPTSEDCDESQEDEEDESQTETTATESDAPDPREVAQNISARFSAIRVSKPPLRRR